MSIEVIPNSFNDFIESANQQEQEEAELTLEEKFTKKRAEWVTCIREMSTKMRKIFDIQELMGSVYNDRQIALEYYHMLLSLLIKVNKEYRKQYTTKYDFYSFKGQKRFPNETSKTNQILSEMEDIISKKESMNNMLKYMENTIKTIDNVIYGMKYRIEIEQISRGK